MATWKELKDNPRSKQIFSQRAEIIRGIREFFWNGGFEETATPSLVKYPGQEPYLDPFVTQVTDPLGSSNIFYLQTSPELAMKKLLVAGFEKIFQICPCYRNGEDSGGRHNPEFTMIEWYRAPGNLTQIMDDTEQMVKVVATKINKQSLVVVKNIGGPINVPIHTTWRRATMKEIWQEFVGIDLDNFLTTETLRELVMKKGYEVRPEDEYEDLFYKIFLNEIEPKLGVDKPVFVYDYPTIMTSLSKPSVTPGYSERFELYAGGMELANAFGELTNPTVQLYNLERDKQKRKDLGKDIYEIDQDFIAALAAGMPPAGGIALGVDRLVMLLTGARDISEVIFQTTKEQLSY